MEFKIREMRKCDKLAVLDMMRKFYSTSAVYTNGSEEIFENDINFCTEDSPYAEGYIIEFNYEIVGYAMIAKSFSMEFGKPCIWIEDLYIKHQYRGKGAGKLLMNYIETKFDNCIFRLEVESENEVALNLYRKCGFGELPYMEMKK